MTAPEPIRDAAVMRAVAHPARLALLEHLTPGRTATATECAELVGLSPSATSYHLRALAKVGFLEQAPSRGDGREHRWQRAVGRTVYVDGGAETDPDLRLARRELTDVVVLWWERQLRDYLADYDDEPADWSAATQLSQTRLIITAEELDGLNKRIDALLAPYRAEDRADAPPGTRPVSAQVRIFPLGRPPVAD